VSRHLSTVKETIKIKSRDWVFSGLGKQNYTSPRTSLYISIQNLLSYLKIKIYRTVILPVVLYGYETWSLTLGEEHRLRIFESREWRRTFGPKGKEDGSWRKLHNDKFRNLYSLSNIVWVIKSKRMRWVGHVACMGEGRGVYRVLVRSPEGKRPLGRPRRRWEDNITDGP
jgi:hypothetical protein